MPKGTEVYDDFSPKMHILRFLRADEHPILVKNMFFVDFVYFFIFSTNLVRKGMNTLTAEKSF